MTSTSVTWFEIIIIIIIIIGKFTVQNSRTNDAYNQRLMKYSTNSVLRISRHYRLVSSFFNFIATNFYIPLNFVFVFVGAHGQVDTALDSKSEGLRFDFEFR